MEAQPSQAPLPASLRSFWSWATGSGKAARAIPPILFLILAVALSLRLYGITWDQGNFFHPDERSIYMRTDCMYRVLTEAPNYADCTRDEPFQQTVPGWPSPTVFLDADKSPLNPHWFPLGTMIIYVLVGIKLVLAPIVTMGLSDLALAGRTLSALADVGTVFMVYALGKRLYSRNAGLLAATLVTFTVVHLQISHFYRPETFTNLFTLASFWYMLNVLQHNRVRDSALLGLFVGLSFATKLSVLPLLLPLAVLYGYLYYRMRRESNQAPIPLPMEGLALRILTAGAVAAATFFFLTPYALLDFPEFLGWNLRELDIVRNAGSVPYTLQYVDTPNLLYELRQTIVWGLGIPLGLLAWGGFLATAVRNVWRPRFGQVLLLLWAIPLLFTVVTVEVKFLRYTFPLMPVFIMLGSGVALQVVGWLRKHNWAAGRVGAGAVGFVVIATAFYGLAFESIYTSPHPAVQASQWINANVPPGTPIATDNHWDEGIPDLGRYPVTQLPMFDGDSVLKIDSVAKKLARADYLIFYSNRTYGVISRVPERYPYSSNYYRSLFSGDLGFELVKDFSSYPRLLGVAFADDTFSRAGLDAPEGLEAPSRSPLTINLGYADNDAIDYDHPLVLVFENTIKYSSDDLLQLLLLSDAPAKQREEPRLMLTPSELEAQQSGGTWSDIFNPGSMSNRLPILVWLLLVELAFLAALPLGFLIFGGLYDKGYLLTKTLAILLIAYIPWVLAALKILPFERFSIFLGLAMLALISAGVVLRKGSELWEFVRTRWRTIALEEGLFLAAFLIFVAIRWANPDLWHPFRGGEKPMDFAYLNAIIRSSAVPPYDPWFAGGYLNYYYFGQFIVATLIKATGILPEIAYNLAVPLMFALTIGGAFSIAYNLAHALREHRTDRKGPRWGPAAAGLAAVLLIAVLGNMGSAIQLVINAWRIVTAGATFPAFDFWAPSRMMPDQISINEFPFWTFLFSDLHAHLIAIPFSLLVIGLSLNLVRIGGQAGLGGVAWRKIVLPLGVLALAIGSLAAINTWDYPSYLLFGVAAVAIASFATFQRPVVRDISSGNDTPSATAAPAGAATAAQTRQHAGETKSTFPQSQFLISALPRVALMVALAYVLFLPFHIRNVAFDAGVHSSAFQTNVLHYIAIYALFLFVVVSFLVYESRGYIKRALLPLKSLLAPASQDNVADAPPATFRVNRVAVAIVMVWALMLAYMLASGYVTVALLFALTSVAVLLATHHLAKRTAEAPYQLFLLTILAGALGIGIAVDLITVNNDIDRMNTVFKLGLEAWVLFGLFTAVAAWHLATRRYSFTGAIVVKGLWLGGLSILVLAAGIFPVLGTRARLGDRFSTEFTGLNGAQFTQTAIYRDSNGPIELRWDWDGIEWLRANVKGSPVVAEGNTDPHNYRWGSRIAIYTGLPTIIGWGWHQQQQRASQQGAIRERLNQVRTLFSTEDKGQALKILQEYNVKYVYVGQLERLYYPSEGLHKFDEMTDAGVALVYANPEVKIYEVRTGGRDI